MALTRKIPVLILLPVLLHVSMVLAQETQSDNATVTYPATFFAQFSPVSVNDMLSRIPGIGLALEGNQRPGPGAANPNNTNNRGLGDSDQILINGKRMAGKANEAQSQLNRIAASQVDYIQIIRGTSGDLDVRNSGQIVNIVLLESPASYSVSANLGATWFHDDTLEPVGSLALNGQSGLLSYLFSAEVKTGYEFLQSFETSLHPDLAFNETLAFDRQQDQTNYTLNSNLVFDLSLSDRLAINLLYSENDPSAELLREVTDYNIAPPNVSYEREVLPATLGNWEIGGDYEHSFANGEKFKILAIANQRDNDTIRERSVFSAPGETESKNLFLATESSYRERILRSSYTFGFSADQTLELGIEAARTVQDSVLRLGQNRPGQGSPDFGGLVPVAVPNSDSTVEEMRYEAFLVHNWQLSPRLSLESALLLENSEIEQSGDIDNKRDFSFIKPKFDLRFNISRSLQLRTSVEKFVSQLSFADFSAATNSRDDDQDTVAGNPELEQEQIWRLNLNLDYRLPNDGGVLNTRFFYFDVNDAIGRIDISRAGEALATTNGNVGDGTVVGLNLDASIRLGFLQMPGAVLTAGVLFQDSYIDDPLIGFERKIVPYDRGNFRFGYRQDVTSRQFSYGFNYRDGIDGSRTLFDIDNVLYIGSNSDLTFFFEKQGPGRFTYRLEGANLLDHESCRERRRYTGYLRDGQLREIERSCTTNGRRFTLSMRGTF
ncbi:MAG: TonB-dependent receptor [Pseudohongiellaceae bacterium]